MAQIFRAYIARSFKARHSFLVWLSLVGASILALSGCQPRSTPQQQALAYYKSIAQEDWKTLYALTIWSEEGKKAFPNASSFQRISDEEMKANPNSTRLNQALHSITNISVGEPVASGDAVDVPTSAVLNVKGRTYPLHGMAHMKQDGGMWKVDASTYGEETLWKSVDAVVGFSSLPKQ